MMPNMKPDLEWLKRAVDSWADWNGDLNGVWIPSHTEDLAGHILGNWLMVEEGCVQQLLKAAKTAAEVISFHPDCAEVGACLTPQTDPCGAKEMADLHRAIANLEKLVSVSAGPIGRNG